MCIYIYIYICSYKTVVKHLQAHPDKRAQEFKKQTNTGLYLLVFFSLIFFYNVSVLFSSFAGKLQDKL